MQSPWRHPQHVGPWRDAGLPYYAYKFFLQERFGHRVQRVSVDAGFTCPNVDGTVARGGCLFCNNASFSPSRRLRAATGAGRSITEQLDAGISRLQQRYRDCRHFLAYFQPATNTYAPVSTLRAVYEEALSHPQIRGLAIGTRPDCVAQDVLELLAAIARRTYVSVEYGMQTMHDRSLDWMNRGHHHAATVDAIERSRGRGLEIGVHLIVGLPGETRADMRATAREIARLGVNAVKLHNLYVVHGTPLADLVARGDVQLLEKGEYVQCVVDMLERLSPATVIQRLGGEAPAPYVLGPAWCRDKTGLRQALEQELARRGSHQAMHWPASTAFV